MYYLASNISQNISVCINITASDVVLDGNGHVVAGNGTGYGIYAVNVENVTVKNLILTNWSYGAYLDVEGGEVENVSVANSAVDGIYVNGSSDVVFRDVTTKENGRNGNSCEGKRQHNDEGRGSGRQWGERGSPEEDEQQHAEKCYGCEQHLLWNLA